MIYEHRPLGDKERYRNKREEKQIQEVHKILIVEGRIDKRIQNLNDPLVIPVDKSTSSRVRKHQGRIGEHATMGGAKPGIHTVVKEITKNVDGVPEFPSPTG